MSPALTALAIQQAPAVLALLRDAWTKRFPGSAPPSDEQVIAAYRDAFAASMAKSEAWLEAHPRGVQMAEAKPPREYPGDPTDRT
jgi:hypothetical protein